MSTNPAVSDIAINGQNFSAAVIGNNASPASTEGAKTIADAINSNTGVHGAIATAFNKVQSKAQAHPFLCLMHLKSIVNQSQSKVQEN